jgi:hypothetical protein
VIAAAGSHAGSLVGNPMLDEIDSVSERLASGGQADA